MAPLQIKKPSNVRFFARYFEKLKQPFFTINARRIKRLNFIYFDFVKVSALKLEMKRLMLARIGKEMCACDARREWGWWGSSTACKCKTLVFIASSSTLHT